MIRFAKRSPHNGAGRVRGALSVVAMVTLALGATLLAGCSQNNNDLRHFITATKARKSRAIEPIPQPTTYQSYTYPAGKTRDPFAPLSFAQPKEKQQASNSGPRPDPNRRREPLEQYPLDSLRMVGILERGDSVWGLVRDPDGTIHRVKTGNYMGQNYGRITSISENKIQLVELVPNGQGGWVKRKASLVVKE